MSPSIKIQHALPAHTFSRVEFRTSPHAVCTIRLEGSPVRSPLRAYADAEGIVALDIHPSGQGSAKFVVDCEVDGRVTQQPLELRFSHDAAPAPQVPSRPHAGGILRPALSEEEMLRLSRAELLERGYPLRPDPETGAALFASWRKLVSSPIVSIEPRTVARPDVRHNPRMARESASSSDNWCGFELPNSLKLSPTPKGIGFTHYDYVRGMWVVPALTAKLNDSTSSSVWVGIDGDGTPDLIQAGTESDVVNYPLNEFASATIASHYAWTEFLPQQKTSVQITNFPVRTGDQIFVEVWIGNAGSGPDLHGQFGVFLLMNLSTGMSTQVFTPVAGTTIPAKEAVWIVERPQFTAQPSGIFGAYFYLPSLADFGSVTITDAYAGMADTSGSSQFVPYFSGRSKNVTMTNQAQDTILATVTSLTPDSMRFDWKAFGGSDILGPAPTS